MLSTHALYLEIPVQGFRFRKKRREGKRRERREKGGKRRKKAEGKKEKKGGEKYTKGTPNHVYWS